MADSQTPDHADDGAATDLPPGEGGRMNFGGTDAAYDAMEDKHEGDAADMANKVDRTDMDGLDTDPPRPDVVTPEETDLPPTAPGDHSRV